MVTSMSRLLGALVILVAVVGTAREK